MSAAAIDQRLLSGPNPFGADTVRSAWEPPDGDVGEIHSSVSEAVVSLAEEVRGDGRTRAVLITGQPGSGKTHLLRRIRSRLHAPGLFAYIPPVPQSDRLYRFVLRQVIASLDHPVAAGSPTQIGALLESLRGREQELLARYPGIQPDVVTGFGRLSDPLLGRKARQWLEGAELDDEDLQALGVGSTLSEENEAFEALISLGKLTRILGPVVVCFDQLEYLAAAGNPAGFETLGGKLANLHDAADNLLLVVSLLDRTWFEAASRWPESARHRIGATSFNLEPLTPEQGFRLCQSRLAGVYGGHRPPWDGYPFRLEFFQQMGGEGQFVTPRLVLHRCRAALDNLRKAGRITPVVGLEQAGPAPKLIRTDLARWLGSELKSHLARKVSPGLSPPDESVLHQGLARLLEGHSAREAPLGGFRVSRVQENPGGLAGVGFQAERNGRRVRVFATVLNTLKGTAFAQQLKKVLAALDAGQFDTAVVMRDRELPVKPTWEKSREYLAQLRQRGGQFVHLGREESALLDAIVALLADAAAGNLAVEGRTVWVQEARDRLADLDDPAPASVLGSFLQALREAMQAGVGSGAGVQAGVASQGEDPTDELARAVEALIQRRRIVRLSRVPALLAETGFTSRVQPDADRVREAVRRNAGTLVLCTRPGVEPLVALRPRPLSQAVPSSPAPPSPGRNLAEPPGPKPERGAR